MIPKEEKRIFEHPAVLYPEFRQILYRLTTIAVLEKVWAVFVFMLSAYTPHFLENLTGYRETQSPFFGPGILYSMYSLMVGFYILLACFLTSFLSSPNWLKAALIFAIIPGPGFAFGLPQIPLVLSIWQKIRSDRFRDFFRWHARIKSVKDLTSGLD